MAPVRRFDLSTGKKCQMANAPMSYKAAHGSQLVHTWVDAAKNNVHVVVTNLDDPGLNWQCQTAPIPP